MTKEQIINDHIKAFNLSSYLEIGVQNGHCFSRIRAAHKVGVEPMKTSNNENFVNVHWRDSDSFFANNEASFDVTFIDGLHHKDQVMKDVSNAVRCTNKIVFVHDVMPDAEKFTRVPRETRRWFGDVYKAWRCALDAFPLAFTIDKDCGLGVIPILGQNELYGSLETHTCPDIPYDEYIDSDKRVEPWYYLTTQE